MSLEVLPFGGPAHAAPPPTADRVGSKGAGLMRMAGAGLLTLYQIFPYTLGANVGTTLTAILAAMAVSDVSAITVAFAHLLFNVCGIAIIWPVRRIRDLPIKLAEKFAAVAAVNRWIPLVYIGIGFYAVPFLVIAILR